MTLAQLSRLVGASPKWCQNALRRLGISGRYDRETARTLALTYLVHVDIGLRLDRAWSLARRRLGGQAPEAGIAGIVIDLGRFEALWGARLAALREHPPRARGRPLHRPPPSPSQALAAARAHGLDLSAIAAGLHRRPSQRLIDLDGAQRLVAALRR